MDRTVQETHRPCRGNQLCDRPRYSSRQVAGGAAAPSTTQLNILPRHSLGEVHAWRAWALTLQSLLVAYWMLRRSLGWMVTS